MTRHGTGITDAAPLQVHRAGGAEGPRAPVDLDACSQEIRGRRVLALLLGLLAEPPGAGTGRDGEGGQRHILA